MCFYAEAEDFLSFDFETDCFLTGVACFLDAPRDFFFSGVLDFEGVACFLTAATFWGVLEREVAATADLPFFSEDLEAVRSGLLFDSNFLMEDTSFFGANYLGAYLVTLSSYLRASLFWRLFVSSFLEGADLTTAFEPFGSTEVGLCEAGRLWIEDYSFLGVVSLATYLAPIFEVAATNYFFASSFFMAST